MGANSGAAYHLLAMSPEAKTSIKNLTNVVRELQRGTRRMPNFEIIKINIMGAKKVSTKARTSPM